MIKPRVSCSWNPTTVDYCWMVYVPTKKPEFFEHWRVAIAFAVYVCCHPHVMQELEQQC